MILKFFVNAILQMVFFHNDLCTNNYFINVNYDSMPSLHSPCYS